MIKSGRNTTGKKANEATIRTLKRKLLMANKILELEKLATPFGHISVRIPGTETFLITRSISPAVAVMDDILVCDMVGQIIKGKYNDTYSEVVIHTGVYKKRPDVNSAVHFHSTYVIGLSLAGLTVIPANLQAAVVGLEPIPVFKKMVFIDTPELGDEVAGLLGPKKAVILKGHGAVAVGESIEETLYTALNLERSAMYQWMARSVGKLAPVSVKEKKELTRYHASLRRAGHGSSREWTYYEWKLGVK
jgi:ribulose-5-phosphate 4-epimerase/fuculose-1-phosphate aldolase